MSSSNVCGADRYDLPGPTWRRLTCDLPAGHNGKHHNELFDWPRARDEPRLTAGEYVLGAADLRAKIYDGWRPYDPDRPRPVYTQIDYWPPRPARRAGWYPRKPRGARP